MQEQLKLYSSPKYMKVLSANQKSGYPISNRLNDRSQTLFSTKCKVITGIAIATLATIIIVYSLKKTNNRGYQPRLCYADPCLNNPPSGYIMGGCICPTGPDDPYLKTLNMDYNCWKNLKYNPSLTIDEQLKEYEACKIGWW
jgi:hypothetical protein